MSNCVAQPPVNAAQNAVVEPSVKVGQNVVIEPFAVVKGDTVLCDGCVVGSFSYIDSSVIGRNSVVRSSRICDSVVGDCCTVGPYAHLREHATIGDGCRVGNFVEIKNSRLMSGVKASHLSYIGDATVGERTNIGCGVVFVNFDGRRKHHTTVGKNCFIGCNANLVAPVNIGDGCFVACGTTVDSDLPDGAFGIGRSYLTVKQNAAAKYIGSRKDE